MALEINDRPGALMSPDIDVGVPSPDAKPRFKRQMSDSELSPLDTPRKNKRKLSEPKRRTTDFSIKRFCPDSPGSACSESGRSEESTPERVHEDLRDSPSGSETSPGITSEKDAIHPHLRTPLIFSDMRPHPYFIPQFYYNRYPGYPGAEQMAMFPGYSGLHNVPVQQISHPPSSEHSVSQPSKKRNCTKTTDSDYRAARVSASVSDSVMEPTQDEDNDSSEEGEKDGKKCRKNYKNMTRERRVEANARERSRVHTISAAFDGLRRAVPSYSYNQKLSKLAILRIACSYINALTKLTDEDETPTGQTDKSFAECVDNCTRTIQTEGKARRRH